VRGAAALDEAAGVLDGVSAVAVLADVGAAVLVEPQPAETSAAAAAPLISAHRRIEIRIFIAIT
jgi:hypothetical protein